MTFQTNHLSHEQLCDLLLANCGGEWTTASPAIERSREHVRECHLCAGELSTLEHSLTLFRSTTDAWASHEWHSHQSLLQNRRLQPTAHGNGLLAFFSKPAIWATVAAAALLAVTLPLAIHHPATQKAPQTVTAPASIHATDTTQSDEALLEEIDQTLSAPIPTAMEPLADPTAGRHTPSDITPRKN